MPQIIKDLKRLSHLSSEQIKITASQLSTGSNLDKKILNISFESHNGQNKILHNDFKNRIDKLIIRHDNNRKKSTNLRNINKHYGINAIIGLR